MPTNSIFVLRPWLPFAVMGQAAEDAAEGQAKDAVEAHGHDDVQTKVLQGSTNCNIGCPDEHCYATSTVDELCYGENVSDPTMRTDP